MARVAAQTRFEADLATALSKGDCAEAADPAALARVTDTFVETLRAMLLPPLRTLTAATGRRIGAAVQSGYLANDFSIALVAAHSNTAQPLIYRLGATWGSHEGSMLLWVLILALCSGLMDGVSGQVLMIDRGTTFFDNLMRLYNERNELEL